MNFRLDSLFQHSVLNWRYSRNVNVWGFYFIITCTDSIEIIIKTRIFENMKIWQFITISHQVRRCLNFLKSLGNVSLIMIGKRSLAVFTPALLSDRRDVGYLPVWRSNTFSQQNGRSQPFIIITISKTRRKFKEEIQAASILYMYLPSNLPPHPTQV